MASGLRKVRLTENTESGGDRRDIDHIVGVDESGNNFDGVFVLVAVQCPRSSSEKLAELLIELDLQPWVSKSSSPPEDFAAQELSEPVSTLLSKIESGPITWNAQACWGGCEVDKRAMTSCIAATKALTSLTEYEGEAAILHDGGGDEYGTGRIKLRRAAANQFEGFAERHTPIHAVCLDSGDRIYPEITTADYIAGYLRSEIIDSGSIDLAEWDVGKIDDSWSTPSNQQPDPEYVIETRNRQRSPPRQDRAASWIEGRRPPSDESWGSKPLKSLVSRLQSDTVQKYLLEEL